jgi:hypothetical protein
VVFPGEDERAGRWSGSQKVECGIHVPESAKQGDLEIVVDLERSHRSPAGE